MDFCVRGKNILLIIGGGIAAYKALELVRRLAERACGTRAILTKAGAEFVTPLSVSALTGEKIYSDLFSLTDEAEMGHIQLSRSADPGGGGACHRRSDGQDGERPGQRSSPPPRLLATDKPVLMAPGDECADVGKRAGPAQPRSSGQGRRAVCRPQ